MKIRTWAEQQQIEHQSRLKWLQEIASLDIPISQICIRVGMDRGQLHKMAQRFGVELPTVARKRAKKRALAEQRAKAAEAEAKRQIIISKARQSAQKELQRRKAKLMAEGFTEAQAMRAVAHQLGIITQEAAQ